MLKKLILATAGLAITLPALADNGYHRGQRYRVVQERHVVVYRPAPRPAYFVHAAPPPPVVVYRLDAVPLLFGALVGAAVVHGVLSH